VIRFSAGLVVVAIGVLCVGGVTSKLSLVYVAIAVSAFALIVLAIGVVLKREELFGDLKPEELLGNGSELVPAGAGTSAGSSAAGRPVAAPPASSPGYGLREGGFNAAAFPSGTQVRPTWTPKEGEPRPDQDRVTAPVGGWGSTSTPPFGTPLVAPRAWDGAKDAKQPPAPPSVPAGAGAPSADAGSSGAGSSGAARSWFDRPVVQADTSGDADIPADEDDDWPTRYSWLDDEEADEAVESDDVALESDDAVAAEVEASDLPAPAKPAEAEEAVTSPTAAHTALEGTDAADEAPVLSSVPDPDPDLDPDPDPVETAEDEPSADDEPSAEHAEPSDAKQDGGAKMVTVVPGVPRYHEPDCILIRFMPENDVKQKSIPEAKAANCTPCAACQPEG
jgi:hypothetical protein